MVDEKALTQVLSDDPGDPAFIELADHMRRNDRYEEALLTCLKGLSANPSAHRGRLLLARLFFERGFWPSA